MVSPVTKKSLPKDSIDSTEKTLIRVLYVDDEVGLLKGAKQILEMRGSFQVGTALSVDEAMEKMKKKAFDVIVSDHVMSERNGLDFLRELREGGNDIPFILFTGKGREEVAIRALNLGADRYFNKIGHPEAVYGELAYGIRQVVDRKRADVKIWDREERLRAILTSSPDAIIVTDLHGTIIECNEEVLKLAGASSKKEVIGKKNHEFIAKEDRQKSIREFEKIGDRGVIKNRDFHFLTTDGRKIPAEFSAIILKDAYGKPIGTVCIARDISERKRMEGNLRESEEKYRKQFEGALDAIFLADAETGILLDCNRAATELVGREKSEIVGKHQTILHPPEELRGKFSRTYKLHLRKKEGQVLEAQGITKTGEIKDVEIKANVFELRGKKVMHGAFRDVTERKRIAGTLQASEEKYRRVVEQAPDSIMTFDVNGVVTSRNKAAIAMSGHSNEDIIGKHFSELKSLSKDDVQKFLKLQKSLLEGKVPEPFEIVYHRKDGASAFGEVHISLMKEGERITGFQAIMRDITKRKAAEDSMRKSEDKSRTLLANLPQKIFFKDKNSVYISCNENYARDLKVHSDEIAGKTDYDFYPKILAEKYRADDKRIIESGETEEIEEDYIQDGHRVFVHTVKTPVKDENDNVVGILGIFWDITEQKKAEQMLKESAANYREIINGMNDTVWVIGLDGKILDVNDAAVEVLGYSREELLSMGPPDFDSTVTEEQINGFVEQLKTVGKTLMETVHTAKDGKKIPVEISSSLVTYQGKQAVLSIARDITERKLAEKAIQESEEKWKSITEYSPDHIMLLDRDANILYINHPLPDLTSEEMIGKSVYDHTPSEFHEAVAICIESVLETGKPNSYYSEYQTRNAEILHFQVRMGPVFHSGEVVALVSSSTDITERQIAWKTLEETMNELATINEKLGVVGKLTRHDARNKLSVITNNVYLVKQKLANNPSGLEYLGDIESAIDQIEQLFDFARTYELLGMEELSYVSVEKSVKEAAMLFSELANVKLVNECHGLTVLADSMLRQLFYNLIDDTIKHGEKVSQIKVYYKEGKDQLKLVYEDDGVGIPEDEKELIFKEGYGKGTGYGLYLIKKMCETYGWTIRETGKPGKGAQFTMTIPKRGRSGKISYTVN